MITFAITLTVVVAGIFGYFISKFIKDATVFLLRFAAGGLFYIATTDLIPEIRKEIDLKKSIIILEILISK